MRLMCTSSFRLEPTSSKYRARITCCPKIALSPIHLSMKMLANLSGTEAPPGCYIPSGVVRPLTWPVMGDIPAVRRRTELYRK